MGKRIKLKESSLTRLIKRMVMEQTYSTTTEPSLGATDSYIHTQTKQADDAKDSEDHVVIDNQPDVEHYLEEEEHEMPEEWMDELEDEMENLKELMKRIKLIYKNKTKIDKKGLDEILKHDLWWDSKKCLKMFRSL